MPINKGPHFPIASVTLIVVLGVLTIAGSFDAKTVNAEQFASNSLTPYEKNLSLNYFKRLAVDTKTFLKDFKKTTYIGLNSDIEDKIIPMIENVKKELVKNREKEKELNKKIQSYPHAEYEHNKLELSSFMVDKLKNQGLVYELIYNYQEPVEETSTEFTEQVLDENGLPVETESYQNMGFSDKFLIRIYKINEGDNYSKLNTVLDEIYIKESYEITNVNMEFDEVSRSYYLELIVGI